MEIIWQVEFNPYCQKVLAKHWPKVPRYGDIKEIDFTKMPAVDLICGGFPCQPVSCAGKRQGDQDERWLWPEFYRAVCEARPRWVLVENVPGLLSAADGRLFGGILGDLSRRGYDAEWDLLPAAAFGAPHLRFRLFLVAHPRSSLRLGRTLEPGRETEGGTAAGRDGETLAHASSPRCSGWQCKKSGPVRNETRGEEFSGRNLIFPHSNAQGLSESRITQRKYFGSSTDGSHWWTTEPDVGRVAHGVPARVDQLKCLGNAVVPQIAEWIGRKIMEARGGLKCMPASPS
jgi:DNA (cytosine-5)-methyltransferase 1